MSLIPKKRVKQGTKRKPVQSSSDSQKAPAVKEPTNSGLTQAQREFYSLFNTNISFEDEETSTLFVTNWPKYETYLCVGKTQRSEFENADTSKQLSKWRCYSNIFTMNDDSGRLKFRFEDNFFFENKGRNEAEAEIWRILRVGNEDDRPGYITVVFINCGSKKKHKGMKKKPLFLAFSKKENENFIEGCLAIKDKRTIYSYSNNKGRDFVNVTIFLKSNFTTIKTAKKHGK